ncbi:MAG: hypothetical protein EXS13_03420 [Planctomycetes bacterium]|nr:hypothetical protein [Planctomycetota bacterium]
MVVFRRRSVCRSHSMRWRFASVWLGVVGVCFVGVEIRGGGSSVEGTPRAWSGIGPRSARAEFPEGDDTDADGLSDEFENFCNTSAYDADCDDDGFSDGAEWILRSDPNDPESIPDPRPAVRLYAYEVDGALRVCTGLYPSDISLIDAAAFVVSSPFFVNAVEGDPGTGLGVIDLSDVVPTLATNVCGSSFLGLGLATFDIDFDLALLRSAPLVIGWALTLADSEAIEQIYVSTEGTTSFMIASGPAMPGGASSFVAAPLQPIPPPNDEDPEYCSVAFSDGTPAGVATLEFSVTAADCEPDGLLYCIAVDCTALAGQTFLMLDYGYLQGKLAE